MHVDTTFQTQQRDLYESGLARQIGANALAVWGAIKSHADFATGEAYPGVRRLMFLTGLASATVQKALVALKEAHLLRVERKAGQKLIYVARERLDVRVGARIMLTIVIDYVPNLMRERLEKLKAAARQGDFTSQDVWAEVDVIPGPGFEWNPSTMTLQARLRADEVPVHLGAARDVGQEGRAKAKLLADRLRKDSLLPGPRIVGPKERIRTSCAYAVSAADTDVAGFAV